ncbi:MAG: hypothetical protein ACLSEY_01725 [Enterocloster sp.]
MPRPGRAVLFLRRGTDRQRVNSGGGSKNRTIEIAIDGSLVDDDGHYM